MCGFFGRSLLALGLLAATACMAEPQLGEDEPRFASAEATLLDFEFDGEFVTNSSWSLRRRAEDQILYTIGHLNWDNSVGRLDKLEITDLQSTSLSNGLTEVTYHATLPVAWGSKTDLPTSYEFTLPKQIDTASLQTFTDNHSTTCVDRSAYDVTPGSMWYYYRPQASGCEITPEEVVTFSATISESDENTEGKYPEYHKIWEDDVLDVVAIFGKYEDGAVENSDAGIRAYNRFAQQIEYLLGNTDLQTTPADLPYSPGVDVPEIIFDATLSDGRQIRITMILVDNVRTAGREFDDRYNELSGPADMIFYNGHAGLGSNTRALARKGEVLPGKYQIFFMNGCDTFAYVDTALTSKKMAANPDDPMGTKYLDMITNAMPSYFSHMSSASIALIRGLAMRDAPRTYEDIFDDVASVQVALVTGEEDNVFTPDWEPPPDPDWTGMEQQGVVDWRQMLVYETPKLAAGQYTFTLAADPADASGDADLYVRADAEPNLSEFDCSSRENGSEETCTVTLTEPGTLFVGVFGYYRRPSGFLLTGAKD